MFLLSATRCNKKEINETLQKKMILPCKKMILKKIYSYVIGLSMPFIRLGKKYFLRRHNSKRYSGGLTWMDHPVY